MSQTASTGSIEIHTSGTFNFEMFDQYIPKRNKKYFDRKNPNAFKEYNVDRIRSMGRLRGWDLSSQLDMRDRGEKWRGDFYPNTYHSFRSMAHGEQWCRQGFEPLETFVDFGCGDSPDSVLAKLEGYKHVYAVDLFPPNSYNYSLQNISHKKYSVKFIKGDICEPLPIPEGSVDSICCSAVMDLIEPEARHLVYEQAFRLLKPGGTFSVYLMKLAAGYGFTRTIERELCYKVGFKLQYNYQNGFVLRKELTNG